MKTEKLFEIEKINSIDPQFFDCSVGKLDNQWYLNFNTTPYSRLYYFYNGEAWAEYNGKRIIMTPGNLYLIPAGLPFTSGCEDYAEKIYIHLSILKSDGFDLASELDKICCLPLPDGHIKKIVDLCKDGCIRSILKFKGIIISDVLKIFENEHIGNEKILNYSEYVKNTITYVQNNLCANLTAQALANINHISVRTLNNYFLKEIGKTVSQYIDEMLIIRSEQYLLFTKQSIAEISNELGFCDQFYFARKFKEKCGKTPSSYRKETLI